MPLTSVPTTDCSSAAAAATYTIPNRLRQDTDCSMTSYVTCSCNYVITAEVWHLPPCLTGHRRLVRNCCRCRRNMSPVSDISKSGLSSRSRWRPIVELLRANFFPFLIICGLLLCQLSRTQAAPPTFNAFSFEHRRIFTGSTNSTAFFHTLQFDPGNDVIIYVGAVDFVYRLNAENIAVNYARSTNLTRYMSVDETTCRQIGNLQYPNVQCRNHIRAVIPVADNSRLYICSTGAYNPQEIYIELESLNVVSGLSAQSGRAKCPYNPLSVYAFTYVVSGNPYNVPSLYAAVATDTNSDFVAIIRPALKANHTSPVLVNLLRTDTDPKWINTAEPVHVVAAFDVGQYVYYFFRELALESTAYCTKSYYSRVARICKNDEGGVGLNMEYRFTSFLKARLVCSVDVPPSSVPYHFNEIYDVKYNSSGATFHALFMANSNGQWGSAVCTYKLSDINNVFDDGSWLEQAKLESAWLQVPDEEVPKPRPGQCTDGSKHFITSALSFIKSHTLMMNNVSPDTGSAIFYSKNLGFNHLEVDVVNGYTILFLYQPETRELYRVAVWRRTVTDRPNFNVISIWQPFAGLSSTVADNVIHNVWSLSLHTAKKKTWLYVSGDDAVVQLNPVQCSAYKYCSDCVRDPLCGWSDTSAVCHNYRHGLGLLRAVEDNDPLAACSSRCLRIYNRPNVIPGMALELNCSSNCRPPRSATDVEWTFSDVSDPNSIRQVPVPISTDSNYVLTADGGLVILNVKATEHVGTFHCIHRRTVLVKHKISTSVCEYGDNVRDTFAREYVKWCNTFDNYHAERRQWQCMKRKCVETNCIPDIKGC